MIKFINLEMFLIYCDYSQRCWIRRTIGILDLHKVTHKDLEPFDYLGMLCIVPIEETRDTILVDWEVEWLLEVSDCQ